MNKVEKIKAEIKRRYNILKNVASPQNKDYYDGKIVSYIETLDFLNSLEEPVSNDLEEAAMQYAKSKHKDTTLQQIVSWDFKAGAQWQKEQMIDKACDWLADNYSKYIITKGLATIFRATIDFDTIRMIEDFKKAMEE